MGVEHGVDVGEEPGPREEIGEVVVVEATLEALLRPCRVVERDVQTDEQDHHHETGHRGPHDAVGR